MSREDREKKRSAARRRAEQHGAGYTTTCLRIPDGIGFYDFKEGQHEFDILPYVVKRGKNEGGNPFAEKGELFYERTYFAWRRLGPAEKMYVALGETFNKPDPVADWKRAEVRKSNLTADEQKYLKDLKPQERQIFLVYDRKNTEKGIQLLDVSHFAFGALLDSRVQNSLEEDGWDLFYLPDEDGMTLRVTVEEQAGAGFTFNKATAIDFKKRKEPLPPAIAKHGIDLDDMPIEMPYEKLKAIFLNLTTGDDEEGSSKEEEDKPQQEERKQERKQEEKKEEKPAEKEKPQEKKEEKKETATLSSSIKVNDEVLFQGKKHSVFRINAEAGTATLLDENGDPVKASLAELKSASEKAKPRTAAEAGLSLRDEVLYSKKSWTIIKISADGTSLTLMDEEDNMERAIGVDDVKLLTSASDSKPPFDKEEKKETKKETKTEKPPEKKEEKKETKSSSKDDVDDDKWDDDWDK